MEPKIIEVITGLTTWMDIMDMAERRWASMEDISEDEEEDIVEEGEKVNQLGLNLGEEMFIKAITRIKYKPQFDFPNFNGNLNAKYLLD